VERASECLASAPKGTIDGEGLAVSLKRYPDTNLAQAAGKVFVSAGS